MEDNLQETKEFKIIIEQKSLINKNNSFLEENVCSICFDSMNNSKTTLRCGHTFHESCINRWIKIKPTCPLCRRILKYQLKIRARKFKNIFVRYTIICNEYDLIIKKYYLDAFVSELKLKYSFIKKMYYKKYFTIIYNKLDNFNVSNNKHIIFKILNSSNETLFFYLKNKIQIIN